MIPVSTAMLAGAPNPYTPASLFDPIGLWYADDFTSTPRKYIPNKASTQAVSPSLMNFPSRMFNNAITYTKVNTVVTDGNAADRNGVLKASTVVGTGNWALIVPTATMPTYPAGTYTIAFDYRRSGAVDQQFRCRWDASGGTVFTATSVWQRGTHTQSLTAAAHQVFFTSFDAATGASFELCNLHVFAGASDLLSTGEIFGGHLYMGKDFADAKPTYASGLIDYNFGAANTGWGAIQFETAQSFTNFTFLQVAQKVGAGSNFHALLSNAPNYLIFTPYLDTVGRPITPYAGTVRGTEGGGMWMYVGSGMHCLAHVYDGTTLTIYRDGLQSAPKVTFSAGPVSVSDLFSGIVAATVNYAGYKWSSFALWNRTLTAAELQSAYTKLKAKAAITGNTLTTPPARWYVAEGDSISAYGATVGTSYAYQYPASAASATQGTNYAFDNARLNIGGANTLTARAAEVDSVKVSGANNILSVLIGANDLFRYVGGGAQYAIDLATYCDARRAAGWKVAVGTVLTRSDVPTITAPQVVIHNTERAILNTAIRGWVGTHCDAVMDFAADPTIGPDASSDNATYYQADKLHPNQTGQNVMAGIAKPVLDAL